MATHVELTDSCYCCCRHCMYLKLLSVFDVIMNIRQYKRLISNAICDLEKCQGCAVAWLGCEGPHNKNLPLEHIASTWHMSAGYKIVIQVFVFKSTSLR
jgi:hypothetical protein